MGSTKIHETTEYSKFELCVFNRNVRCFDNLEKSMLKHGWISAYPMHVIKGDDGKLKIQAGHHRFTVAKKLGIPAKYVVVDDCDITIHELEKSTVNWSIEDYLTSFLRLGYPDYAIVKEYHDRTGIGISASISMLGGEQAASNNKYGQFKSGTYKVKDTYHAEKVAMVVKAVGEAGIKWSKARQLTNALSKILFVSEIDEKRLIQKIKKFPQQMEKQSTLEDYLHMLEGVYNFCSKEKTPLAFLAREESKKRSAVNKI